MLNLNFKGGTFKQGWRMHNNNDPIGGKQCRPKNRQQWGELIIGKPTFLLRQYISVS